MVVRRGARGQQAGGERAAAKNVGRADEQRGSKGAHVSYTARSDEHDDHRCVHLFSRGIAAPTLLLLLSGCGGNGFVVVVDGKEEAE